MHCLFSAKAVPSVHELSILRMHRSVAMMHLICGKTDRGYSRVLAPHTQASSTLSTIKLKRHRNVYMLVSFSPCCPLKAASSLKKLTELSFGSSGVKERLFIGFSGYDIAAMKVVSDWHGVDTTTALKSNKVPQQACTRIALHSSGAHQYFFFDVQQAGPVQMSMQACSCTLSLFKSTVVALTPRWH